MALTWDVTEIKNAYRRISEKEYNAVGNKNDFFSNPRHYDAENNSYYELRTETNTLIFICGIFIGIPNITKDNYKKVYERIRFSEIIAGKTFLTETNPKTNVKKEKPISLELIESHIGLKTNGIKLNKTQFLKKTTDGWEL